MMTLIAILVVGGDGAARAVSVAEAETAAVNRHGNSTVPNTTGSLVDNFEKS